MAEQDEVYALQTNVSWADLPFPGQVPIVNEAWMPEQNRIARTLHTANKLCWDSEANIRRATN